jgi:hypothetical protein
MPESRRARRSAENPPEAGAPSVNVFGWDLTFTVQTKHTQNMIIRIWTDFMIFILMFEFNSLQQFTAKPAAFYFLSIFRQ